ncbi:hypothetical protein TcCL_Unassigned06545, partial [Trypanosoma cruzi]
MWLIPLGGKSLRWVTGHAQRRMYLLCTPKHTTATGKEGEAGGESIQSVCACHLGSQPLRRLILLFHEEGKAPLAHHASSTNSTKRARLRTKQCPLSCSRGCEIGLQGEHVPLTQP